MTWTAWYSSCKKSIKMPYIYVIDINFRYENIVHFVQIPMSATGTHTCASVYNLYKYISIYKPFKVIYFINNDIFIISICKPPTYLMVYNARKWPNILFVLNSDIEIQIENNLIVLSYISYILYYGY